MFPRARWVMQFRKMMTTVKLNLNHYEVLGLKPTASATEIKIAYFEKTKLYHPDKVSSTEENLRKFRLISEAYEILGNELSRKHYDEYILGLTAESKKEDSFKKHIVTHIKSDEKLDRWTKNHLNHLRNNQFLGMQQAKRRSTYKTEQSNMTFFMFSLILFGGVLIILLRKDENKRHKNI